MASPRIYLTGRLAIEHGDTIIDERHLPGRQGRLAFACLMAMRRAGVPREELYDVIWPDGPPAEPEAALSAILSKLRGALRKASLGSDASIDVRAGSIDVRLPAETRVDVEEAAGAVDEAEGAVRTGNVRHGWGCANVAVGIARRPFLPGEDAPWIEAQRRMLRGVLTRGLHVLSSVSSSIGDGPLAIQYAEELVALEPFRETGYQQLMRAHAGAGNRAEALRVFARCRELLREELGTAPSPQTEAVYLEILRAE